MRTIAQPVATRPAGRPLKIRDPIRGMCKGGIAAPAAIPAAFVRGPALRPTRDTKGLCACGSALSRTYYNRTSNDAVHRQDAPVRWCPACRTIAAADAVGAQDEVRGGGGGGGGTFLWACAQCGGMMHRLYAVRGGYEQSGVIPLSYCPPCTSVSFRAIGAGAWHGCDRCGAALHMSHRWCAACRALAERWRHKHSCRVPPPTDPRFPGAMAEFDAYENRGGGGGGRTPAVEERQGMAMP